MEIRIKKGRHIGYDLYYRNSRSSIITVGLMR